MNHAQWSAPDSHTRNETPHNNLDDTLGDCPGYARPLPRGGGRQRQDPGRARIAAMVPEDYSAGHLFTKKDILGAVLGSIAMYCALIGAGWIILGNTLPGAGLLVITVICAVSGFSFRGAASHFLPYFRFGIDWDQILYLDRVTDTLGLIYWGYVIIVLQFTDKVKREFFVPSPQSEPDKS